VIKAVVFLRPKLRYIFSIKLAYTEPNLDLLLQKERIMVRLYTLIFMVLFTCATSSHGMLFDLDDLPGAQRQTDVVETIVRDALSGGLIKPSIIATIMFFTLLQQERNLSDPKAIMHIETFGEICMGYFMIGIPVAMKAIGYIFDVTSGNPTELASGWRDRCRLLYGFCTLYVLINATHLLLGKSSWVCVSK
jgi:hypothetical protein